VLMRKSSPRGSCRHALLVQIRIGGGENAHIHAPGLRRASAPVRLIRDAKQFCLLAQGTFAIRQGKVCAIGQLETADAVGACVVNAPLVPNISLSKCLGSPPAFTPPVPGEPRRSGVEQLATISSSTMFPVIRTLASGTNLRNQLNTGRIEARGHKLGCPRRSRRFQLQLTRSRTPGALACRGPQSRRSFSHGF